MDSTNKKQALAALALTLVVMTIVACGSSSSGGGPGVSSGGAGGHGTRVDPGIGGVTDADGQTGLGGSGGVVASGGRGASEAGAAGRDGGRGGRPSDGGGGASGTLASGGADGGANADADTGGGTGSGGCPAALHDCNGTCVNLHSADNCGVCGNACPDGMFCQHSDTYDPLIPSRCMCPDGYAQTDATGAFSYDGTTCTPWETLCASYCPVTDAGFQMTCHPDRVCNAGFCDGLTICGKNYCTSTFNDAANCGDCGIRCASGQFCVNGSCQDCPDTAPTTCGRDCVDLSSDPANCGTCGHACPADQHCTNGTCACPAGSPDICSGACVNLSGDPANCGTCGHACDTGQGFQCLGGACKIATSCVSVGGSCQSQYQCCANSNNAGTCSNFVSGFGKCCLFANVPCTSPSDCCCGTCSLQYGCCN